MYRLTMFACLFGSSFLASGCATQKESFTPRTGTEQMLVSSAVDKSLDNKCSSAPGVISCVAAGAAAWLPLGA